MPLRFDNISSLSIQHQPRFFQAGFNYSTAKTIRIQGWLLDLTNSFGVTGIWSGINTIESNATDYQMLTMNGIDFGSGRIISMTFADGNDVRIKNYNAELEILETGNMTNMVGPYYSGIDTSNFQYIESFSEDYSFRKQLNGGYGYDHTATVRFLRRDGILDSISGAQSLAKTLFTGSNLGFKFYSGYTNKQGKRFFNEVYNVIDKTCSFKESFNFDVDDGNYSATRVNIMNLDELGVVTVRETATIRGIENPNYQKALSALQNEITGSYYRCSGMEAVYIPTGDRLVNSPVEQARVIDIFNNNIGYDIVYSSKPNNYATYFWDYLQNISRVNGIGEIEEQGTVVGKLGTPAASFAAALQGFAVIKAGIQARMAALFPVTFITPTNYQKSKNETYSPVKGTISYSQVYSNDAALISNFGARKKELRTEVNAVVYDYNKINVINNAEIAQDNHQATVGTLRVSVSIEGDKTVNSQNFKTLAIAAINSKIPAGNDVYLGSLNYSYSPNDNRLDSSADWVYNTSAARNPYPV